MEHIPLPSCRILGAWRPSASPSPLTDTGSRPSSPLDPQSSLEAFRQGLRSLARPLYLLQQGAHLGCATSGQARLGGIPSDLELPLLAYAPPLLPHQLGDPTFLADYGLRFAYVMGDMANGIASEAMVEAAATAGMLGFFGAAGLSPDRVEAAILRLKTTIPQGTFGFNLIHSPQDPALEAHIADLYVRHQVRRVNAAAYLDLTLPVVRYRLHGIYTTPAGQVVAPNALFAKISRLEVARRFLAPPPERLVKALVDRGELTPDQARMAETIPMATDLTAEADSGGHTDNRPLLVLLPSILQLRDALQARHAYRSAPRVGAAGGIATPASAAAAFSMGAAYILTGSINQACLEAGTSDRVRQLLSKAASTDVAMAPAADMFEMGVTVQVLGKGTLFAVRARKLYELYKTHDSVESLPAEVRQTLEKTFFQASLEDAWDDCRQFFAQRDPAQLERAAREPKHKLALLFRSYLGQASRWAIAGLEARAQDYQIWCGPAMGAFNAWAKDTWLEPWEARRVANLGRNLMVGAAVLTRVAALRAQGVTLPPEVEHFPPLEDDRLEALLQAPVSYPETLSPVTGAADHQPDQDTSSVSAPPSPAPHPLPPVPALSAPVSRPRDPIAIVGLGGLFPKAQGIQELWRLLRLGLDAVGEVPPSHWSVEGYFDPDPKAPDKTYARRGAFLDPYPFDPTEFGIPPNILEATDTSQLLGLVVARMALDDAGYGEDVPWDRSRASVLLGVTGTQELVISLGSRLGHPHWRKGALEAGLDEATADQVVERISRAYVGWQENSFPGLLGNVVAGRIANRLNLGGTNCVVDAACASSLGAIHLACLELQSGRSDLVITGGVDTLNDIFMYMCFSKTPALSPTGDARPFSAQADGTILGEGIGMLVLKRLEDAQRDGDRIYAVITGLGTSSDGRAKSIYAPLPEGQARALRAAYRDAGVKATDIGLLEAHGTGTKAGDACEVEALRKVYREDGPSGTWCALGSIKSQIGHTKAAAGAAGLIKAALSLYHKVLTPTIKLDPPNPALELSTSPFYLSAEARPWLNPSGGKRRAAVSSFGFGGSNFHAVLEECQPQRPEVAWDGSIDLLALSSPSPAALLQALETLERDHTPNALAEARARFDPSQPCRLALLIDRVIGNGARRLTQARALLDASPDKPFAHPDGIFYGRGPAPGPLAFLFPGQGSQYVGMLREASTLFPELLNALELAGPLAPVIFPPPTFDPAARARQEAALTRTEVAQPALGAISRGLLEVLRRFGLKPALVAGHSYGELTALYAAGRLDAATHHKISCIRGQLMTGNGEDRGTMLAVMAPLDQVEALLKREGLELVLANRNTPRQGVLSGSRTEVARAESLCQAQGLQCKRLEVAAAFHSPLVAGAQAAFREALEQVSLAAGQIPVVANSTACPYPGEANAARDLLASQLARPVRFVESIERLYADGARTFLEVGPKAALTGMVKHILGDRPHTAFALDSSAGRRNGLQDLGLVLAQLATLGYSLDLRPWQASPLPPRTSPAKVRKARLVIPLTGANYREPAKAAPGAGQVPAGHATQPKAKQAELRPTHPPVPATAATTVSEASVRPGSSHPTSAGPHLPGGHASLAAPGQEIRVPGLVAAARPPASAGSLPPRAPSQAAPSSLPGPLSQRSGTGRVEKIMSGNELLSDSSGGSLGQPSSTAFPNHPGSLPSPRPPLETPRGPLPGHSAGLVLEALRANQESLRAMQALQEQTASIHKVFLDGQTEVQRGFQSVLQNQQRLIEQALTGQAAGLPMVSPSQAPQPLPPPIPQTASHAVGTAPSLSAAHDRTASPLATVSQAPLQASRPNPSQPQAAPAKPPVHALEPIPAGLHQANRQDGSSPEKPRTPADALMPAPRLEARAPEAAVVDPTLVIQTLRAVVAEATGYPDEMLDLEQDMESDLGIDSIKRVEILSMLTGRIPQAPSVEPENLTRLRTLRQVSDFIIQSVRKNTNMADGSASFGRADQHEQVRPEIVQSPGDRGSDAVRTRTESSVDAQSLLMGVVAELTGYPQEMLGLDQDLESDLGIDSIKRVEILSVLSGRLPNARAVEPERLGGLRTLGQVLSFVTSSAPHTPPVASASTPATSTSAEHAVDKRETPEPVGAAPSSLSVPVPTAEQEAADTPPLQRLAVLPMPLEPLSADPLSLPVAPGTEVWVADTGSSLAQHLLQQLTALGHVARLVPPAAATNGLAAKVVGALLLPLSSLPTSGPGWDATRDQILKDLFALVRSVGPRLRESGRAGGALLASITCQDGQFGHATQERPLSDPLPAGLAGLVKSAAREWPEVSCLALDMAPSLDADTASRAVLAELAAPGPVERGFGPAGRVGLQLMPAAWGPARAVLKPGEVVVITGGARGVTAACALSLAQSTPATLLLLGRSPEPTPEPAWLSAAQGEAAVKRALLDHAFTDGRPSPKVLGEACQRVLANRELTQTLASIAETGTRAVYRAVDVRDGKAISAVLEEARSTLGPIRGLIHGAGVLMDRRIEDKTDEQLSLVLDTKVAGARALLEASEGDDLAFLAFFSSVSGHYGRKGQSDYAMANQVLDGLAMREATRRPTCRVVSLGWGPWDGGMVNSGLKKEFQKEGLGLIPLQAGAQHLVRELQALPGAPVTLLVGLNLQPEGTQQAIVPRNRANAPRADGAEQAMDKRETVLHHRFDPISQAYLQDHRLGGKPVVPLAMILELLARAALQAVPGSLFHGVDQLQLNQGIVLEGPLEVLLRASPEDSAGPSIQVPVRLEGQNGRIHAQATVLVGPMPLEILANPLAAPPELRRYPATRTEIYAGQLFHGPLLQGLKDMNVAPGGATAILETSPSLEAWLPGEKCPWVTDPLMVDGVFQALILWCRAELGAPSLPSKLAHYRQVAGPLPRLVQAVVAIRQVQGPLVTSDVELLDGDGRRVARLEGYVCTVAASLEDRFHAGPDRLNPLAS